MRAGGPVIAAAGLLALVLHAAAANAPAPRQLAPYKDELFAYSNILETGYGGDFLSVEYSHQRDLVDRDWLERKQVDPKYISLDTKAVEFDETLQLGKTALRFVAVGKKDGKATAIAIFLHGRGNNRLTGAEDQTFGGNFNRIKNLMMLNGGLYLSPDFSDYGAAGAAEIAALILHFTALSPGARVYLGCASLGGHVCWRLAVDREIAPLLGGLIFLDSFVDEDYLKIAVAEPAADRLPIYISGCDEDKIVGWRSQLKFFQKMKQAIPDYPIRFVLWKTGGHGTSLRMVDWRLALNWMMAAKGRG